MVSVGKFTRTRLPSDLVLSEVSSVVDAAMIRCSASLVPAILGRSELRLPQVPRVIGM
ncbi:hypothetical protein D3C71_1728590 [compost metagenome]